MDDHFKFKYKIATKKEYPDFVSSNQMEDIYIKVLIPQMREKQ